MSRAQGFRALASPAEHVIPPCIHIERSSGAGVGDPDWFAIVRCVLFALGQSLGLEPQWARRTLTAIGNCGKFYERNLGIESELQLPRG